MNASSALGPHIDAQVQPLGVVVSGSATSSVLIIESISSSLPAKGQPK